MKRQFPAVGGIRCCLPWNGTSPAAEGRWHGAQPQGDWESGMVAQSPASASAQAHSRRLSRLPYESRSPSPASDAMPPNDRCP